MPGAHAHALRHTPAHVRPRHARARYSGRYRAAGRACPGAAGGGSCEGCPSGGGGHLGGLGGDVDGAQSRLQGSREGLSEVGKGGREAAGRWIRGLGAATHLHARPRRARMRPAHRRVEAGRLRRCSGRGSGRGLLQLTVGEAVVGGGEEAVAASGRQRGRRGAALWRLKQWVEEHLPTRWDALSSAASPPAAAWSISEDTTIFEPLLH